MGRKKALDDNILTDSTYYILLSLVVPKHGYAIMQEVSDKSNGIVEIGPASLYTILSKLQKNCLIELIEDNTDRRKCYKLTEKGKELIIQDIKRRRKMIEYGEEALNIIKG